MSQDNSNVVAIVGILAIILLVAVALYFFLIAGNGGDADIQIDLPGASSLETTLDVARGSDTSPVGVHFLV